MKNFNLSLFLGCCVIGICLVISSVLISNHLPETPEAPYIPSSLSVTTSESDNKLEDFLSEYEASDFLKISYEDLTSLIKSHELDSCFTKINGTYVFSKTALEEWMGNRIG